MTERNQIYRCSVCGNVVEVVRAGAGILTCCGKPMIAMKENTTDGAREKHVPVVEKTDGGYRVTVGSVAHPMLPEHYIEWIDLQAGDTTMRHHLKPGDQPTATFATDATDVTAREYCNLHGLWKG